MRKEDREYLDLFGTSIRAEFKAGTDLLGYKIDEVINHQKETNGKVKELNFNTQFAQWVQKNPTKTIIAGIALMIVLIVIVSVFGVKEVVQTILNKSL